MSEWTAGGNSVKFESYGDGIAGTVVFATIKDGKDYSGNPIRQRVIDIRTDAGEDKTLYVKPGQMSIELGKALKAVGREAPTPGDRIAVVYERDIPKTPPLNPQKVFAVAYKLPEGSTSAGNVQSAADLI